MLNMLKKFIEINFIQFNTCNFKLYIIYVLYHMHVIVKLLFYNVDHIKTIMINFYIS